MNPSDKRNLNGMPSTSSSVGRPTRRLFLFRSMAGAAAVASATRGVVGDHSCTPSCALSSEQTIGPYYLDIKRIRKDLTEGKPGVPLELRFTVVDATRCLPIQNAALDIWHCDAFGIYSGFAGNSPDGPPIMPRSHLVDQAPDPRYRLDASPLFAYEPQFANRKQDDATFLRGVQLTDADGVVRFSTIYPGWYENRDTHIHLRVHVGGSITDGRYEGGHASYTGQLFFPDEITDAVARRDPYTKHEAPRTRQAQDDVFMNQDGSRSMVVLTRLNARSIEDGFLATAVLGIDPNAITTSSIFESSWILST